MPYFQGRPWPDGVAVLHVYAVPDVRVVDGLGELVAGVHRALRGYPVAPLGLDRLHVTLEMVVDADADRIGTAERAALAGGLRRELAGSGAVGVRLGPPLVTDGGVVLDVRPGDALDELRERIRAGVRAVRGDAALGPGPGAPHMSVGYAYGDAEPGSLREVLRGLGSVAYRIGEVELLGVRYGQGTGWDWERIARVPFGT